MTRPTQGKRIFWLVRALTATGLLAVFSTLAVIGWTMHGIRANIAQATSEQQRLNRQSDQLRQLAVDTRGEILTQLDDAMVSDKGQTALIQLKSFVQTRLAAATDAATIASLQDLSRRLVNLSDLSRRTSIWHDQYQIVSNDLRQQVTLGNVRTLIAAARDAVESLEGQRRLEQAIAYRRWRHASGPDADQQARDILQQEQHRQTQGDLADFKSQLAELARLVELLGGEDQFDSLADIKDNQIVPVLERTRRTVAALGQTSAAATPDKPADGNPSALSPQITQDLETALFGNGYISDASHQTIQVGSGGLFALRRDALQLSRQRETLKSELSDAFSGIEVVNAGFIRQTQTRTVALTRQMEESLGATWQRMFFFGGGCSLLFIWLSWRISRGINAQVQVIDHARVTAEADKQTMQKLVAQQQAAAAELAEVHKQLLETSRQAGMAEVATGVLHNVGNVLNSVNVSATVLADKIQQLPVANLAKASAMIESHRDDLGAFLTADEKGKQLPGYFSKVAKILGEENVAMLGELSNLAHGIEHIKQVVQLQQDYAKSSTFREKLNPAALIDDALRINLLSLERHQVQIVRELSDVGIVNMDKHKTLQVLINLISNAKNAVKAAENTDNRIITIRLCQIEPDGVPTVRFQVADTGVGIPEDNLARVFNHGFTTRAGGHGFGLHTAANSAREMGGSLTVASDGIGRGATFTLDIPIVANEVAAT